MKYSDVQYLSCRLPCRHSFVLNRSGLAIFDLTVQQTLKRTHSQQLGVLSRRTWRSTVIVSSCSDRCYVGMAAALH